jgi:hypothetical protein
LNVEQIPERQIRAFIDRKPFEVVLSRESRIDDGAGGSIPDSPTELLPQEVRIVGVPRPRTVVTQDGREVQIDKAIIGLPDLDVQLGDTAPLSDGNYEVVDIDRNLDYRVVAGVTSRG